MYNLSLGLGPWMGLVISPAFSGYDVRAPGIIIWSRLSRTGSHCEMTPPEAAAMPPSSTASDLY